MQAVIISMHLGMLKAGILRYLLWDPGLFAAHFHDTASAALGMITGSACALAEDHRFCLRIGGRSPIGRRTLQQRPPDLAVQCTICQ